MSIFSFVKKAFVARNDEDGSSDRASYVYSWGAISHSTVIGCSVGYHGVGWEPRPAIRLTVGYVTLTVFLGKGV